MSVLIITHSLVAFPGPRYYQGLVPVFLPTCCVALLFPPESSLPGDQNSWHRQWILSAPPKRENGCKCAMFYTAVSIPLTFCFGYVNLVWNVLLSEFLLKHLLVTVPLDKLLGGMQAHLAEQ